MAKGKVLPHPAATPWYDHPGWCTKTGVPIAIRCYGAGRGVEGAWRTMTNIKKLCMPSANASLFFGGLLLTL